MSQTRMRRNSKIRSNKTEKKQDIAAVVITLQIVVCMILFITLFIVKNVNENNYSIIKYEYNSMLENENINYMSEDNMLNNIKKLFIGNVEKKNKIIRWQNGSKIEKTDYNYLLPTQNSDEWSDLPYNNTKTTPDSATLSPIVLNQKIIVPVEGIITSLYSQRQHPITGVSDFHTGIDIAADEGVSVLAALSGEVTEIGYSDIYGNYLILTHAMNLKTFYAHCSEILVQKGAAVNRGERIAKVGQTGIVTGSHLHFSVIVNDKYTDPLWILGDNVRVVE